MRFQSFIFLLKTVVFISTVCQCEELTLPTSDTTTNVAHSGASSPAPPPTVENDNVAHKPELEDSLIGSGNKPTDVPATQDKINVLLHISNIPISPHNVSDLNKNCDPECEDGPQMACPVNGDCGADNKCCYDTCRKRQVCRKIKAGDEDDGKTLKKQKRSVQKRSPEKYFNAKAQDFGDEKKNPAFNDQSLIHKMKGKTTEMSLEKKTPEKHSNNNFPSKSEAISSQNEDEDKRNNHKIGTENAQESFDKTEAKLSAGSGQDRYPNYPSYPFLHKKAVNNDLKADSLRGKDYTADKVKIGDDRDVILYEYFYGPKHELFVSDYSGRFGDEDENVYYNKEYYW